MLTLFLFFWCLSSLALFVWCLHVLYRINQK